MCCSLPNKHTVHQSIDVDILSDTANRIHYNFMDNEFCQKTVGMNRKIKFEIIFLSKTEGVWIDRAGKGEMNRY